MKNINDFNNDPSLTQPFALQRERTLMPSEFRERMSARHKSRKSSAARSATHSQKSRIRMSSKCSNMEGVDMDINSYPDNRHFQSPTDLDSTRFSYMYSNSENKDDKELISSSSHIALNQDFKIMMDNAYSNYEGGGMYSIKTPPSNMQIGDLMTPLDEWSTNSICEKKYTVLPSINSPKSDRTHTSSLQGRLPIVSSQNNQLDFTRDKIESEADFFADFRVNTSRVKQTPRQEPLPPIRLGEISATHSASSKKSGLSSRLQTKSSEKRTIFS